MLMRTVASTALAAFAFGGAAAAQGIPVEEFAKYETLDGLQMSPEGDRLVGMVWEPGSDGMRQAAAMWDISGDLDPSKPLAPVAVSQGNERLRLTGVTPLRYGKHLVRGEQTWTGQAARCGLETDKRGGGAEETFIYPLFEADENLNIEGYAFEERRGVRNRSKGLEICAAVVGGLTRISSPLPGDPDHILLRRSDGERTRMIKYNLKTGREENLYRINGDDQLLEVDGTTGEPIAYQNFEPTSHPDGPDFTIYMKLKNPATGEIKRYDALNTTARARNTVDLAGFDEQSGKYIILTDKYSNFIQAHFFDPATGQLDKEPIFAHPRFNVSGAVFGSKPMNMGQLLGFSYSGEMGSERFWLDPMYKSIQEGLDAAFPGQNVMIGEANDDYSRIMFRTYASDKGISHYILEDRAEVIPIGRRRGNLPQDQLGTTEFITYTARDGLEIPAYLHLPPGYVKGSKRLPLIVNPHGGPWARDFSTAGLRDWVQYFTSRGFAVLKPQYRGSADLGMELWKAGDNQWGKAMQDDKDDGAQYLVDQGIVDPDRMIMHGYSYGGYAAMAAAVRPDVPYKCTIAGAGVSDLTRLGNLWGSNRIQRALQGHTVTGLDPLDEAQAGQGRVPVLVIHGDRDVRVPEFHGIDYYNAIKSTQPQSRLYIQEDAPHGLPWPQHRREYLEQMDDFIQNVCGIRMPVQIASR